jgi:biopolymer transport protein ExbD
MTWKIRHAGSPRSIDGLTSVQVLEGLQEEQWEPTDEIMGPEDTVWTPIESHPQFAELAADIEPPPPPHREDETRLDMNPLIDVCLVLLIFFILTTSYATLQKVLDMPGASPQTLKPLQVKTVKDLEKTTIMVTARLENGKPVIRVENQVTEPARLMTELNSFVRSKHVTEVLLMASDDVDWGTVVAIQDAAKGAGITRVLFGIPETDLKKSSPAPKPVSGPAGP